MTSTLNPALVLIRNEGGVPAERFGGPLHVPGSSDANRPSEGDVGVP